MLRFCVRNSGVTAVIEGCGDHGCEYMTGGRVIVLGATGRNFAAGMSGGIAYILDTEKRFESRCNQTMVDLVAVQAPEDLCFLQSTLEEFVTETGSSVATQLLADWPAAAEKFVKVEHRPGNVMEEDVYYRLYLYRCSLTSTRGRCRSRRRRRKRPRGSGP